jgi:predicted dehydrogenase
MTDEPDPRPPPITCEGIARRDFIRAGGMLAMGLLGGGGNIQAEEIVPPAPAPPPAHDGPVGSIGCAVIGLGDQGRALLGALSLLPGVDMRLLCDHYAGSHHRAKEIFPGATMVTEARKVLDDPKVQAVWIATPTHLHRALVQDALQAGKHVYCEAPLAHTIEDARAIAKAAAGLPKLVFQAGLQLRSDPQRRHVLGFIRAGALGTIAQSQAHWHHRTSWRRAAANDERQNELNWRLSSETSCGLMGEVGIHQLDLANWFLKGTPRSVTGFGGIMAWRDGRSVDDTVQCVFEYPDNLQFLYDATLVNSFDAVAEVFRGSDAAVLLREQRAWMIKEADAPTLGWEVYAFREKIGDATGIALVADATKILAAGKQPGENREVDPRHTPLVCACEAFLSAIRNKTPSPCGFELGFQATVTALKAHEATVARSRIVFEKEWFEL